MDEAVRRYRMDAKRAHISLVVGENNDAPGERSIVASTLDEIVQVLSGSGAFIGSLWMAEKDVVALSKGGWVGAKRRFNRVGQTHVIDGVRIELVEIAEEKES